MTYKSGTSTLEIYADTRGWGTCRSCGARVEWAELVTGKRMPFNGPITVLRSQGGFLPGDRKIEQVDMQKTTSHFATCPQAKYWRQRR